MRFCGQCGASLGATCPQCNAELPPGFRFCGHCGTSVVTSAAPTPQAAAGPAVPATPGLPSTSSYTPRHLAEKILKSRSALEGERRQVTVLFADIAGFTSVAEKRDPEEVHAIVDACFERITAEVHRFEGTVNQYTGDGVMALFGAPIAHEDSARRAVHAALGIQREIRQYAARLRDEKGIGLAMRIGVNTGAVVVGRIGDDLRMDYTAVGDTTNLAARMQQMARPGSVLITEATHRLVEGFFETLAFGAVEIKNHEPVRAFEVLRPRGTRTRIDVGRERGLTPFVGRERELDVLRERFADVAAGRGQVVLIAGDAGIGKSRLLYELRRALDARGEPVTWLEGQCISYGQAIPFLPLIDQLRKNFHIEDFDGEPEIIAKIEHGMRAMGEVAEHVPFIRYLLSVDPGDAAVTSMDAATRRKRVFAAIRALSIRGAALRPLILVVEDLHWMDTSSEEYLASLMDSMATLRIMLILTFRLGYTPPFRAHSFQTTLSLSTLPAAPALDVACGVLGVRELPEEVANALMLRAEGVPLFIEEVAKTLLDLGVLRREGDQVRLVKGPAAANVPETIQDIIMARLDRLGEDGKRTVQVASVIGREFLVRLLSRVAGLTEQIDQLLHELQGLELIYDKGAAQDPAYIFKHALIQDVAYNSLLRERRRSLHRAVGYALEDLYPDRLAEHYAELAHHFAQAEEWVKAFEYFTHSGDRAKDASANTLAIDWYAKAIDAAGRATPPVSGKRLAEAIQRRGQLCVTVARFEEALAECQRLVDLARREHDRRLECEALADTAYAHYMTLSSEQLPEFQRYSDAAIAIARELGDERLLARTLALSGMSDQVEGRLAESDVKFEESIALARRGGFRDLVPFSEQLRSLNANWQGRFADSIAVGRDLEALCRELHDGFIEVFSLSTRAFAHIGCGDYREAWNVLRLGRTLARERENHFIYGRLTNTLGWLHQEFGDFARAHELDRESADLGQRIKNGNVETSALINIGFDLLNQRRASEALPHFEATLVRAEKAFGAHRWRWRIHLRFGLATTLLALGRDGEALAQVDEGSSQAVATNSRKYVGWFHAIRGEVALRAGDPARAVAELQQALTEARAIGYPTLTWQAGHLLAQAHRAAGQVEAAWTSITLAHQTIQEIAAAAPEPEFVRTLMAWPRLTAALETYETLRRA